MVFKSLNNLAPEYLCSKFTNRSYVTFYILRDSVNKLAVLYPGTTFGYSGAVLWNSLSASTRQAESLVEFRNLLRHHIR